MATVFLYSPQDFHNICMVSRTLEVLGHDVCYVYDPNQLVKERYGKARTRELRSVSAGAFERVRWQRISEPVAFLTDHVGRTLATVADPQAPPVTSHRFEPTDMLVFGSESRGLPPDIVSTCSTSVSIPMPGKTPSLNLAVSVGILLFECHRQSAVR